MNQFSYIHSYAFFLLDSSDPNDILDCVEASSDGGTQSRNGGPDACEVKPHSKPWIVHFFDNSPGACGGTLVAKNVVLTAKHCSAARRGNIATLGDHSRNDFDIGQRSIRIKDVFSNLTECPRCDFKIVILDEEVQTNEYVQIADLPRPNESCPPGKNLVACGWGEDKYNKTRSLDKLWCVAQECVEMPRPEGFGCSRKVRHLCK